MTINSRVCYGCPLRHTAQYPRTRKSRCSILQAKLDGVRGMGLRSIDFDCPVKTDLFKPGQEVTFNGYCNGLGDEGSYLENFTGYVIGWKGNRVRVVSEETDKPFVGIFPFRLERTNNIRRVCIHCGLPEGISVMVKMSHDDKPRPWICRDNGDFGQEPVPVPCEYTATKESA